MTPSGPEQYRDVETCVEKTLRRVGRRITLGAPLGLGKPNQLVNEFYRRAKEDPRLELGILTALSLEKPRGRSELERRLVEPLTERLFGGYPELAYLRDLRAGKLPANVTVREFFFQPGALLEIPAAQQAYISSNYTHVVRDLLDRGINVLAQLVAVEEDSGGSARYSLSCNPDLTLDLLPRLRKLQRQGEKIAVLAQVNRNLPFMYGGAVLPAEAFDGIVDHPAYDFPLFGPPNRPVTTADYLIALYASALIRDGGTLQIGIGALGDAVTYLLELRHRQNEIYQSLLADTGAHSIFGPIIDRLGGTEPFATGLYGATEMLVDGFLDLYRAGILRRKVYDHADLQRLLNAGRIGETVTPETLQVLVEEGVVPPRWGAAEFEWLQRFGILRQDLAFEDNWIVFPDGSRHPGDWEDEEARQEMTRRGLGPALQGGRLLHAGFFLGPQGFYEALRNLPPAERALIDMTAISYVNQLYGDEELKRLQRREARFLNTVMMVTLTGAAVSDGLEDGRVVSGVGGQYNFVAMAHALEDGRSILMLPSTRERQGRLRSNFVWSYGHLTIPRHLRDLVVTEYGIADLRGKTDAEVIAALLRIADSRFQESLLREAKGAGKIPQDHGIEDRFRANLPERLERELAPYRKEGLFPEFPFGTDLTPEEIVLSRALKDLQARVARRRFPLPRWSTLRAVLSPPAAARPYLERMGLDRPRTLKEKGLQKVVLYALATSGVL